MIRIKRLSVVLALLPLACGGDDGDGSAESFTTLPSETSMDAEAEGMEAEAEAEAEGMEAEAEGDGDGDPTGDGDGDGDPTGDGDGDPTGDGDGDPTGDGDGDPTGDGDGDPTGDGDGDPTGDGDGDPTGDGDGDPTGDGDGDPTGDGDGDMTTGNETDACDEFAVVLEPIAPNVMITVDKSRSMFINYWDHDNNGGTPQITRWNSLYQVVDNITTTFDGSINFGANLFPSVQAQNVYGPAACITSDYPEVAVGPGNGAAILATIPGANVTNSFGGTPATLGVTTAYDHLMTLDPQIPRAVILVTDGAANCDQDAQTNYELFEVYDASLPSVVGDAWTNDGIPTYVVGIDIVNAVLNDDVGGDPNNINPHQKLNEVAQVGGTGSFFNSQDQAQLEAALEDVINSVQSCTIPLEVPPFFEEYTKVIIDGMEWPMVNDCGSEDGWVYTNPNGPYDQIELCGDACDEVKQTGEAQIEYYCNPG